ncbi:MAG: hypothetical protein COA84_13435 [Robiginitomaculum sp.]|nr:MAG: hypothetical protein COA84_13435 [Robiginitomaculum sp.]
MNLLETINSVGRGEVLVEVKVGKSMTVNNPKDDRHGQSGKIVKIANSAYLLQFKDGKRGSFNADELDEGVVIPESRDTTDQSNAEAIKIISQLIAMSPGPVGDFIKSNGINPLALVTAIKGRKSVKAKDFSNLVQSSLFGDKTDAKLLKSIKDATSKIFNVKEEVEIVDEAKKADVTDKEDDGEGLDPVASGDSDIDNDGDSDESDNFLKKRRSAISKAVEKDRPEAEKINKKKDEEDDDEVVKEEVEQVDERNDLNKAKKDAVIKRLGKDGEVRGPTRKGLDTVSRNASDKKKLRIGDRNSADIYSKQRAKDNSVIVAKGRQQNRFDQSNKKPGKSFADIRARANKKVRNEEVINERRPIIKSEDPLKARRRQDKINVPDPKEKAQRREKRSAMTANTSTGRSLADIRNRADKFSRK